MQTYHENRTSLYRLIWSIVLGLLSAAGYVWAKNNSEAVLTYYVPFSRSLSDLASRIYSIFPFSFAELLLYALALSLAAYLIYILIMLIARPFRLTRLFSVLSRLALGLSVLFLVFSAFWGLNYYAPPLTQQLDLDDGPFTYEQLLDTARWLENGVNGYAASVTRDTGGVSDFGDFTELAKSAASGFSQLGSRYLFWSGSAVPVKAVLGSAALSYLGISGIYSPFTGEANVNALTPASNLPYTICHEMSHRLGVAPEQEANFMAFLACAGSDDARYQYSGYLAGFIYSYNAVYSVNKEDAAATLGRARSSCRQRPARHIRIQRAICGQGKTDREADQRHLSEGDEPAAGRAQLWRSDGSADCLAPAGIRINAKAYKKLTVVINDEFSRKNRLGRANHRPVRHR